MYRTLNLAAAGGIAVVTLNRPDARNAMSARLMREMIACAGKLAARRDLDAVILRGSGKWFSAGADLNDASRWGNAARPLDEQREVAALGYRMARAWEELPQITIAAIEGYAIGGGLALVAALDWRVIAEDAFVSLPEIALGAQWLDRFTARFGTRPAQWHSDLTAAERRIAWRAVARGEAAQGLAGDFRRLVGFGHCAALRSNISAFRFSLSASAPGSRSRSPSIPHPP